MKKYFLFFVYLFIGYAGVAQIVLTHNIGSTLKKTSIYTCSSGGIEWARSFVLEDFGITADEDFTIYQGEVGFSEVGVYDVNIGFNIYEIDEDFPDSFDRDKLIGSSEVIRVYQSGIQLVTLEFAQPVTVPSSVKRILVEVRQEFSNSSAVTFIAGTEADNDFSWFNTPNGGCAPESYTTTEDLGRDDARFYINVTGTKSLGINSQAANANLFYPNPASDFIYFEMAETPVEKVEVLDLQGKVLITQLNPTKVDVSGMSAGIYFVKMHKADKTTVHRFIKD